MMHSFGDNLYPSNFSSTIIGDHIKSWLSSWFTKKYNWTLLEMKEIFPNEYEIWYRWYQEKENMYIVYKTIKENFKESKRRNTYKAQQNTIHEIFIKKYEASIGWTPRWKDLNLFTRKMDCYTYMNYVDCREKSLLFTKKNQIKFKKWMKYKTQRISKFCMKFLNFLTWDRIGLIIQMAKIRRIHLNLSNFSEEALKVIETMKAIIDLSEIYSVPYMINNKKYLKENNILKRRKKKKKIKYSIKNINAKKELNEKYCNKKKKKIEIKTIIFSNRHLVKIKSRSVIYSRPPNLILPDLAAILNR